MLLLLPALPMLKLLLARSGLCGERLLAGTSMNPTDLVATGDFAAALAGVVLRLFVTADAAALPSPWLTAASCSSSAGSGDSSGCLEPSNASLSAAACCLLPRFLSGLLLACLAAAAAAASLPNWLPAGGLLGLALRLLARLEAAEDAPLLPLPTAAAAAAAGLLGEAGLAPAGSGEAATLLLLAVRCTAAAAAAAAGDAGRCCSSASTGSSSGDCA
jgi:hypothetical protein